MRYELLGRSGLRVSGLCLGTMTFDAGLTWGCAKDVSRQVLHAFLDAGGNFVDTHTYGPTEDYLGEFLGTHRDRVVLATKYGGSLDPDDVNASGGHRKSLVRSVESSLRRLRTDYIDLLWLHAWDPMTPVEEVMRACDDLVRSGKVLYIGAGNAPAWVVAQANTLADRHGWSPFVAIQVEYSLVERDVDRELLPMSRSLDVAVAAWTPLASGWLTGKYQGGSRPPETGGADHVGAGGDGVVTGPRRLDDPVMTRFLPRTERNQAIAAEVNRIADESGCAPAHVALNWLRRRGCVPIFGARSVAQVRENLGCFEVELSEEQERRLNTVSAVKLGYPTSFLASGMVRTLMYGRHRDAIRDHRASAAGRPR